MAPKMKHLASKRVGSPPNISKRQKPSFGANFRTAIAQSRFEDTFAHRDVKAGRVIRFDLLESIDFPYLNTFEEFGWTNYLKMNAPVYENLVRAFYCNSDLIPRQNIPNRSYTDRFKTFLMGSEYIISRQTIADALNLDDSGETNTKADILDLAKSVFDDETLPFAHTQAAKFGMHDRLLHLIVTHVLAPFGTQYAIIRKQDYWWMHMIKKKRCPNLPAFIFSDMMKVVQNRESTLVYGMVLSAVFRHLRIDTRCDTPFIQPSSSYLDEHSLGSMGYVKEQNIWVKKAERGTIDPDEVALGGDELNPEEQGNEGDGQETGEAAGTSSSAEFNSRSVLEAILGRFDSLDTRFESITARLDSMELKQDELIAQIQQLQTFPHQPSSTQPSTSPQP